MRVCAKDPTATGTCGCSSGGIRSCADGVPWNAMTIGGRGEEDNAVPTPDGVREPRNRRVTVVEGY